MSDFEIEIAFDSMEIEVDINISDKSCIKKVAEEETSFLTRNWPKCSTSY